MGPTLEFRNIYFAMKGCKRNPWNLLQVKSSFIYKIYLFDGPVVVLGEGLKRSGKDKKEENRWSRKGSKQCTWVHRWGRGVDGEARCQGGGWRSQVHENSRHTFPHIPPAIQSILDQFWVPMEESPTVRHIWVDFAEEAMSAALTIL